MTLTEFHKLSARARWNPGAEAALLWPFGWGVFSVALMWVFSGGVFWREADGMHVSLGGVGIGLISGGIVSAFACWYVFRKRSAAKSAAVQKLKAVAAEVMKA